KLGWAGHSRTALLPAAPMLGAVVSTTVIVCVAVAVPPQPSGAENCRTITFLTGQIPGCSESLNVAAAAQPDGAPVAAGAIESPHSTLRSGGLTRAQGEQP